MEDRKTYELNSWRRQFLAKPITSKNSPLTRLKPMTSRSASKPSKSFFTEESKPVRTVRISFPLARGHTRCEYGLKTPEKMFTRTIDTRTPVETKKTKAFKEAKVAKRRFPVTEPKRKKSLKSVISEWFMKSEAQIVGEQAKIMNMMEGQGKRMKELEGKMEKLKDIFMKLKEKANKE